MNIIWQKEAELNKKGFTLIELIVTIGLLIILFSIVVPRINTDRYSMTFYPDFYILKVGTNTGIKQYKKVELKEDFLFMYSFQNLTFNYRGSPSHGQTITLKDLKTEVIKQITIIPVTGRILLIE